MDRLCRLDCNRRAAQANHRARAAKAISMYTILFSGSAMHDRFVLLKRQADLDAEETLLLSGWLNNYPALALAYRPMEDFFKVYDASTREEAVSRFVAWDKAATYEVRDAFSDLIRAWRNWQPYILAYFDHPVTNASTESLNSLIRVMNRLGRGYSFEALRAKILFAKGAFKKQNVRPKFARRRVGDTAGTGGSLTSLYGFQTGRVTGFQQEEPGTEVNFGVDISILTKLIEIGKL